MKTFFQKIKNLKPTKRKLIQLYCALLFNVNFKGFFTGNIYKGGTEINIGNATYKAGSKSFCVPGINCYSCPGAIGACPLGSLQGSFSSDKSTIFYVGGILLLYCILFGRMICGWFCPFGLIQELLYKIKTPKLRKSPVTRILSYFKYVVLVFFVFIVPITYAVRDIPLPAFCKYICPAGTLEGGVMLLSNKINASYFSMLGPIFTWKFMLLISIVVGSIFIFRVFCRFICPLGALYGLFNKLSIFGVKVEESKCTHCNLCINHCKVDIKHVGDQECISCGECVNVCPTGAISWKGTGLFKKAACSDANTVSGNDNSGQTLAESADKACGASTKKARNITRAITCVLMLAVLIGAAVYYWNQDNERNNPIAGMEGERGNQVGDLCYEYDLEVLDGSGVTGDTVNPSATGKITVINFWGTWCTPCVNELPYFDQIATDYADTVTVIAIHTNMICDTAPGYVGTYYPESKVIFAQDGLEEEFYTMLGGRGTYPYTVILDETGEIVEIFFSSVEYEDLKEVVESILGE